MNLFTKMLLASSMAMASGTIHAIAIFSQKCDIINNSALARFNTVYSTLRGTVWTSEDDIDELIPAYSATKTRLNNGELEEVETNCEDCCRYKAHALRTIYFDKDPDPTQGTALTGKWTRENSNGTVEESDKGLRWLSLRPGRRLDCNNPSLSGLHERAFKSDISVQEMEDNYCSLYFTLHIIGDDGDVSHDSAALMTQRKLLVEGENGKMTFTRKN